MSRKKKSYAQRAAGLATSWMPKPLADFFSTPFGAMLFVVGAPFLLATGVISIQWSNGIPSVTFNRQQAIVVGQRVEQQVEMEARRATTTYRGQQMGQPMGQPMGLPQQPQAAQQFQPAWR